MELTNKQERFCLEYVIDYNGTKAAIRAGYAEKTANRTASDLLSKPDILARVRQLQEEQAKRLSISSDWVLIRLCETLEKCMAVAPVMEWDPDEKCKVETGEYVFDSKGALKALELIGKHIGMFAEKREVTIQPTNWYIGGVENGEEGAQRDTDRRELDEQVDDDEGHEADR